VPRIQPVGSGLKENGKFKYGDEGDREGVLTVMVEDRPNVSIMASDYLSTIYPV